MRQPKRKEEILNQVWGRLVWLAWAGTRHLFLEHPSVALLALGLVVQSYAHWAGSLLLNEGIDMMEAAMSEAIDYPETQITYPAKWADEYRRTKTIASWNGPAHPWFPPAPHSMVLGTLDLFPQYALMHLLAEAEGIQAITWMYLAHVDNEAVGRVRMDKPWVRPVVKPRSKNAARITGNWETMRRYMGDDDFDNLQEAIVRAGFTGFSGEPDLFCYDPSRDHWFFAEAKGRDRLGKKQTNTTGTGWFDIALKTLGEKGRVRVYRVVAK